MSSGSSQSQPRQSHPRSSQLGPSQVRQDERRDGAFLPLTVSIEQREILRNTQESDRLKKNCLSAIMVLGQNKKTIKKLDLNKLIYTGTRKQHFTVTKAVLAQANHDLNKYTGMRLYDIADDKGYLLVNSTSVPNNYRKDFSRDDCNELAVIFLALMEIFSSSEESSTENQIKTVLSELDLPEDELKRYFDMLVKKLYIVPDKGILNREEKHYRWGPRAIAEVDPDSFMESFLDFAESGTENDWPDQKRRITLLKQVPNR